MVEEKVVRATIGWLCTISAILIYVIFPALRFFLNIDFSDQISALIMVMTLIFLDLGKPKMENEYRYILLDGWMPILGWTCAICFACVVIIGPVFSYVLAIMDMDYVRERLPDYSAGEKVLLLFLIVKASLWQILGKSLHDILNHFLSKIIIPEK